MSATTQIRRSEFDDNYGLDDSIKEVDPLLYDTLLEKIKL